MLRGCGACQHARTDSGQMHLTAAVDTLALLQHDENTPKDCSEVTHRGMLDHIGGEHGLCPTGWT